MATCDACGSERILKLTAKCADRCFAEYNGVSKTGYVPRVSNVGGGDYVRFGTCLDCGKIQGTFPVEDPEGFA